MNSKYFFSIAIPFYYRNEYSLYQLVRCVQSIKNQNFEDYEIIISTQNNFNILKEDLKLKGTTIINAEKIGGSIQENVNNAIRFCNGKWIKILFSDDYFFDQYCLDKLHDSLIINKCAWAINNALHVNESSNKIYRPIKAYYQKNILTLNTIGSPSSLTILNKDVPLFDPMTWMHLDADYYQTLFNKFGSPLSISNVFVVNEIHSDQFSSLLRGKRSDETKKLIRKEYKYVYKKHSYTQPPFIVVLYLHLKMRVEQRFYNFIFKIRRYSWFLEID
ncbi:glycosyltransferase family 2 protein [Prochlorococcus marinus XMU1406]|uniref:glycosyltransferase n=1 Tax=Prochlorococcus marinus TaxID=1219 RepID=UPI001ADB938E|nr:glycosyltransferase [Prochlorococcus marinus]MBO8206827.1 glycosyltransferase family 2 protein [Prochlorococcus marinus XMU1406]MCR8542646.1 glycosyltransferase [Prochlorococcus marinus XMU1427]